MSDRRARSSARSRPAALGLFEAVVMAGLSVSRPAQACPFCGHGTAGDSAFSAIVILAGAFFVIRALRRRS